MSLSYIIKCVIMVIALWAVAIGYSIYKGPKPSKDKIIKVKSATSEPTFISMGRGKLVNGQKRIRIVKRGVEVASLSQDSLWTIYDCRATVETLVEVLKQKER